MADLNPGPYEYGADPADYKVEAVLAFLNGDNVTADQYEQVLKAEAEGPRQSKQILALAGSSTQPASPSPSTTSTPDGDPSPGTTEPGGVPSEQPNPDGAGEDQPSKDGQPDQGESADVEPEPNPELQNIQSDKPLWYVETNGQPPADKADLYKVIQPAGSVV